MEYWLKRKYLIYIAVFLAITILLLYILYTGWIGYPSFKPSSYTSSINRTTNTQSIVISNSTSTTSSAKSSIINIGGPTTKYPELPTKDLKHIPIGYKPKVIYGKYDGIDYVEEILTNDSRLYLPARFKINSPNSVVEHVRNFFEKLGINASMLDYSIYVLLQKYGWDAYKFNTSETFDYIWNIRITSSDGKTNYVGLSVSALTGAAISVFIFPDLYEKIHDNPKLLYNKTLFDYLTIGRRYNSYEELMRFVDKILWLINVDKDVYNLTLKPFENNISFPTYPPILFQTIDNAYIMAGYVVLPTGILLNSFAITYYDPKNPLVRGIIHEYRINEIDANLLPLRYFKVIRSKTNVSRSKIIDFGREFIYEKFNLPSYIKVTFGRIQRVYSLVAPWTLKEFYMVSYTVKSIRRYAVILLIDPDTMKVYDYAVL